MDSIIGSLSLDDGSNLAQSTPAKNQPIPDDELILGKTSNLSIADDDGDDTDGDVEMKGTYGTLGNNLDTRGAFNTPLQHRILHRHAPIRPSPLKTAYSSSDSPGKHDQEFLSDDEIDFDDSDIVMADSDHNHSFTRSISQTARSILSPTEFGARIATSPSPYKANLTHLLQETAQESGAGTSDTSLVDQADSEGSDDQILRNRHHHSKTPSKLSIVRYDTEPDSTEDTTQDSQTTFDDSTQDQSQGIKPFRTPVAKMPWGDSPVLQMHQHHHHYYPQSSNSTPSQYSPFKEVIQLPAPWSKAASPKAPAPYLISSYLQLLFNVITSSIAIYILINAIKTVKSDINLKMEEYAAEIAMEVSRCARSYVENKCAPETRVQALEKMCSEWERCMNRDPTTQAGKASVSAETLGLILNSLIEPIGVKAIIVFGVGLISWAFTSNFIFGFVRAKSYYGWDSNDQYNQQQQHQLGWNQQQHQQYNPSTPALLPSGPPQQYTPGAPPNWNYNYTPSR